MKNNNISSIEDVLKETIPNYDERSARLEKKNGKDGYHYFLYIVN